MSQPQSVPSNSTASQQLGRAIFWQSLYHVVSVPVSFLSMVMLARVLSPREYGLLSATTGILGLFNALGCQGFLNHALQHQGADGPDWDQHWAAGLRIQGGLFLLANALAGGMWLSAAHRDLAPLLHLASLALPLSLPHLLAARMLEYRLDFRRLQMFSVGTLLLVNAVSIGLAGWIGAFGVVFGGALMNLIPLTVCLLVSLKWRPRTGWMQAVIWRDYLAALKFGFHTNIGSLLQGARGMAEGAVLPATVGLVELGLINRGQAVFQTTVGRLGTMFIEGVYPVLPRLAADVRSFPAHLRTVLELGQLGVITGGTFALLEGVRISRVLYSERWAEADGLLVPGTLVGMCGVALSMVRVLFLTTERLREATRLSWLIAGASILPIALTFLRPNAEEYLWLQAGTLGAATIYGLIQLRPLLDVPLWRIHVPALVSTVVGVCVWCFMQEGMLYLSPIVRLAGGGVGYGVSVAIVLRVLFPLRVRALLELIPRGGFLLRWLRLT